MTQKTPMIHVADGAQLRPMSTYSYNQMYASASKTQKEKRLISMNQNLRTDIGI